MVTSKIFLRKYKAYEDGFIKRITRSEYVRFWILSIAIASNGQCPLEASTMDSVHCEGQKILVVSSQAFTEAQQVKAQKRLPLKKKMDISPDVWQRLPFWIKELLKMLKNSGS